jgi:hypothetical protein
MTKRAKAFKEMPTEHLKCRSLGHAWEIQLVTVERPDGLQCYRVALECMRCRTERSDLVPAGVDEDAPFMFTRGYRYADGYMVEDLKGWGGASLLKRNARNVLFQRLKVRKT